MVMGVGNYNITEFWKFTIPQYFIRLFALTAGALEEIAATPAPSRPGKRAYSLRYTFSGYYAPDGTYTKASYSFHERNILTGHYCITVYTDSYGPVPVPAGVELSLIHI